jgi:DNA-binding transcriptional ArsR family regulator
LIDVTRRREAAVAQALGEPTRLAILHRLMDGPAPVAELVAELGKPQSQVSNHLAVLRDAALVAFEREGRKSLYRIANASVATLIESLAALSRSGSESRPTPALARARTCYDHLAGSLGVNLYEWLLRVRAIRTDGDDLALGPQGRAIFGRLGVDIDRAARAKRRFLVPCLDWTEKRAHLGGSLGAELCRALVERGWIVRRPGTRGVAQTAAGKRGLRGLMGPSRASSGR